MFWAVLGSVRPSTILSLWVGLGGGVFWLPDRPLIVVTGWLLATTGAKLAHAVNERDKALLIRALAKASLPIAAELEPQIRQARAR
jgi:hypothetical protein